MPVSLLNHIRRAKSASECQNAELKRLTFLRLHLPDAIFSNARSASLLRDTRPASLEHNVKIMWVHPDLMEGQQWTNVTNRKSTGKAKALPCNIVCASSREAETDVPSLTDSEEETIVLDTESNAPLITGIRSSQSCLKKYNKMMANPPKPTPEPTK